MTLFVERRRPAFTPDLLLRVALAWAMICALLLVNAAAIGLIVGLVMTLMPLVGPGLATLIVVVVALAIAGLFGWLALKHFQHATRPRNLP